MMDLISCYSQYSTQITESATSSSISSTSCSNYKPSSSCIISPPNNNIIPSTQTAVASLYKTTLTNNNHHYITITWYRNTTTQGLQITTTTHHNTIPTTIFRLNTLTHTHARLFRKKKGSKTLEINDARFEIYYDLSSAVYGAGAEPVEGYYILVIIDSEVALFLGDMYEEHVVKKVKMNKLVGKYGLVCRKEHFSGNTVYVTKARFSDKANWHDIMIRCTGEHDGLKNPNLLVYIDKRVVIRVKRLQWNFRGNQTIFLDGLLVDLMWDVHDWFFHSDSDPGSGQEPDSGPGSGSGSGHAVFMFRTRSGLDSRLWLEEKIVKSDDQKNGFSLLIYATKS
ncbi:hypothetical protein Tco_1044614 [Tanacetum coccineum]|uniref:Uncharacterized protein n=1 Tax=Tanacetum coccineum TaxID=301880 RepID=A0ABQ5GQZ8_9ASTR